mmetsp:Transcript_1223/g.3683  ORF Transcript_1223/g.3683 Transcript_1223/m.3683 type:complete len:218 (-) Transcript_1223:14-667(-)
MTGKAGGGQAPCGGEMRKRRETFAASSASPVAAVSHAPRSTSACRMAPPAATCMTVTTSAAAPHPRSSAASTRGVMTQWFDAPPSTRRLENMTKAGCVRTLRYGRVPSASSSAIAAGAPRGLLRGHGPGAVHARTTTSPKAPAHHSRPASQEQYGGYSTRAAWLRPAASAAATAAPSAQAPPAPRSLRRPRPKANRGAMSAENGYTESGGRGVARPT